ncbi:hypothetical protein BDV96DRAFT_77027 [Lophiotrema nucula]|uniref:Uncharacterized protein n=1 Tax=Lophiotrema nucula TaxID=690887 RepID=A0A6A5Z8F6_9PLEO|nr:hypothetical protein BDV96DRAFT_77027 [Lophiotrema nucula]
MIETHVSSDNPTCTRACPEMKAWNWWYGVNWPQVTFLAPPVSLTRVICSGSTRQRRPVAVALWSPRGSYLRCAIHGSKSTCATSLKKSSESVGRGYGSRSPSRQSNGCTPPKLQARHCVPNFHQRIDAGVSIAGARPRFIQVVITCDSCPDGAASQHNHSCSFYPAGNSRAIIYQHELGCYKEPVWSCRRWRNLDAIPLQTILCSNPLLRRF